MAVAVPFPATSPPGYSFFPDEVPFDPERHLQLEEPKSIITLAELGYSAADIEGKATPVAASAPFRMLSDEGATVMLETARRLRNHVKPAGTRIENAVRGGCYRSAWLRDLCISPQVTEHMARIYGIPTAPHPMGLHLGHLNFEPDRPQVAIDKWHHDTLPLDYVLMVTDPRTVAGGRFEYFVGTKQEAAELAASGQTPPPERVVAPAFDGPGYAIALHGDMVVHRAGPVSDRSERISMVNGYVALDTSLDQQSRSADLIGVDDPSVLWTEWAKMAAWRSSGRLSALVEGLPFTDDRDFVVEQLQAAIQDAQQAIEEIQGDAVPAEHYGG
jgi:hypothetical protein